jgi:ATP-dependent Clp protease protease subunit
MNGKPEPGPNEAYAVFCGQLTQDATRNLLNRLSNATLEKPAITHLHVLLQSSGGGVSEGVCVYNFFQAFPIPLTVYNSGGIGSIAVVVYLGAKKRIVNQHAAFMIHRTGCGPVYIDSGNVDGKASALKLDDTRTEAILRKHLTIPDADWANLRNNEYWFSADAAVKNGLATDIGDFAPPMGSKVFALNG